MSVVNARTQRLAALRSKMEESSGSKSTTQRTMKDIGRRKKMLPVMVRYHSFPSREKGRRISLRPIAHPRISGSYHKWFIDNCPTTIGEDCPVCKANGILWNSGNKADKKLASSRKRKLNYISNILVVNDPKHSENNGKVFLFKYGKKIFEQAQGMVNPPEFADIRSLSIRSILNW